MRTVIRKIGTSQGLIIPKAYLDSLGLSEGSKVNVEVNGHNIIVKTGRPTFSLEELVAKMTPENAHPEIPFGPDVGAEIVVYEPEQEKINKK